LTETTEYINSHDIVLSNITSGSLPLHGFIPNREARASHGGGVCYIYNLITEAKNFTWLAQQI